MNILCFISILILSSLVSAYNWYRNHQIEDDFDQDLLIEREEYKHVFGIEPFIRAHIDDPLAMFNIFIDDKEDEYENITMPRRPGDSIIKIRKPNLKLHPKVKKYLIDFLKKKNIPVLNEYIEKNRLDQDDDDD